ncbi:MAG: phenylalanine--tRNA ligase subunit beta [Candidatus Geothermincolia bacterium]
MRAPLNWLREYVDIEVTPEELADRLENSGTAVESLERTGGAVQGILTGRVLECDPMPGTHLTLCRVDTGSEATIICGAPNVTAGMIAAVAVPGSVLPDGTRIDVAELRGVTSEGMLLSGAELGINEDHSGILSLAVDEIGLDVADLLGLRDVVLELEITPNRPDCMNMLGIAREVAALYGLKVKRPSLAVVESARPVEEAAAVAIQDPDLCPRYSARVIEGVRVGDAPLWMQARLRAAGIRPISNIVDVTNYVMWEMGQPLHAFDLDMLAGSRIEVRRAGEREEVVTLDGSTRVLGPEDLLIADAARGVALAGVMGGANSEVSDATTRILLESAYFEPRAVMRTAKLQGFSSEASKRFERGSDPLGTVDAAARAIELMRQNAGGQVCRGTIDILPAEIKRRRLTLMVEHAAGLLGVEVPVQTARALLAAIDVEIEGESVSDGETVIACAVPTFRPDLEREIDLVEEIARLYGYSRMPSTLPASRGKVGKLTREQRGVREAREALVAEGMLEVVTYGFTSRDALERVGALVSGEPRRLANPISDETAVLRTTLLANLLEVLDYNMRRRNPDRAIFEIGRVFRPGEGRAPAETLMLGCAVGGCDSAKQWDMEPRDADFFTLKGILDATLEALRVRGSELVPGTAAWLHPGKSATLVVGGKKAGEFGEVRPSVAAAFGVRPNTQLMELDLAVLLEARADTGEFRAVPRFPAMRRDLALVMDERVAQAEVRDIIASAGGPLLKEIAVFDLYRGEQLGEGKKSLAYALTFYADDRTLEESDIAGAEQAVVDALAQRDITLRR